MPMHSRLSEEEKQRISMQQSAKALAQFPGSFVKVVVGDETEDNGEPKVRIFLAGQSEAYVSGACRYDR
jgi:hypothetical protein